MVPSGIVTKTTRLGIRVVSVFVVNVTSRCHCRVTVNPLEIVILVCVVNKNEREYGMISLNTYAIPTIALSGGNSIFCSSSLP